MSDKLPPYPPGLSPETNIRIDREGRFWSEGQPVVHEGLERALASWLGVDPDTGRWILRNSVNWCYVTVEDTPLVVRRLEVGGAGELLVALSDGTTEPLDLTTLRVDGDDVPYCDVKERRFPARFSRAAAFALLERVSTDEAGGLVLALDASTVPVRRVAVGRDKLTV
jgi:hypothetical protein